MNRDCSSDYEAQVDMEKVFKCLKFPSPAINTTYNYLSKLCALFRHLKKYKFPDHWSEVVGFSLSVHALNTLQPFHQIACKSFMYHFSY